MRACVLGSGTFGTAISAVLARRFDEVRLWGREADQIADLNAKHENTHFLPGIPLPLNLKGTTDIAEAHEGADMVVFAVPSHASREVAGRAAPYLPKHVPILTVAKGIENTTLKTMTEVLEDSLPEDYHPYIAVLSGPSFAKEMVRNMPTVVTVASHWDKISRRCQSALQTETFRVYTSVDVVGVQYGGALKNVIAIAAGISDGLGFGHNARAALITRGLAEITRVAVRCGANPLTLSGLSGMGDLVLTCTADLSRNRRVGLALGQGRKLDEVLGELHEVAEGVKTARSARDLSEKMGVELPICDQVFQITYENKDARAAVYELMTRSPKAELM